MKINGMPMCEYIEQQRQLGEVVENISGNMTQHFNGKRSITMVCGGEVRITRKGRTFTLRGNHIEKRDNTWYVDGKPFDFDGEQMDLKQDIVKIEIQGEVQQLTTQSGDVTVNGDVNNLRTTSGDVQCQAALNINTVSGDVTCKGRPQSVNTVSGDINY